MALKDAITESPNEAAKAKSSRDANANNVFTGQSVWKLTPDSSADPRAGCPDDQIRMLQKLAAGFASKGANAHRNAAPAASVPGNVPTQPKAGLNHWMLHSKKRCRVALQHCGEKNVELVVYRCTHPNCQAQMHLQKVLGDNNEVIETIPTFSGTHRHPSRTCPSANQSNAQFFVTSGSVKRDRDGRSVQQALDVTNNWISLFRQLGMQPDMCDLNGIQYQQRKYIEFIASMSGALGPAGLMQKPGEVDAHSLSYSWFSQPTSTNSVPTSSDYASMLRNLSQQTPSRMSQATSTDSPHRHSTASSQPSKAPSDAAAAQKVSSQHRCIDHPSRSSDPAPPCERDVLSLSNWLSTVSQWKQEGSPQGSESDDASEQHDPKSDNELSEEAEDLEEEADARRTTVAALCAPSATPTNVRTKSGALRKSAFTKMQTALLETPVLPRIYVPTHTCSAK